MKSFVFVFGLVCCFAFSNATAQTRIWSDSTGKFSVEATFVKSENGKVVLTRSDNGKTLSLDLTRLSAADQLFVKELSESDGEQDGDQQEVTKSQDDDKLVKDLKPNAEVSWSDFPMIQEDGTETYSMELLVTVIGKSAETSAKFGNFKLEELLDQDGNEVKTKESFMDDFVNEMIAVKRPKNEFFCDHPKNGIGMKMEIDTEKETPTSFTKIKGTVDLVVGAKMLKIRIKDVAKLLATSEESEDEDDGNGTSVKNDELEKLGVELSIRASDDAAGLEIRIEGSAGNILELIPVDAKGEEHSESSSSYWSGGRESAVYGYGFNGDSVPEDVEIQLVIAEGGKQVTVPFEFTDVKIPKPRKND